MAPKAPPQEGQIFKATYSGVPVYECIVKGVAVMRRRADGWLNATQILKVVGLDKPQRTRVLEREVQKNTHEKVQGGYGKYQGTWIPLESAIQLGQQYSIADLLEPLTSYVPSSADSPPPAPKHTVAAGARVKKAGASGGASGAAGGAGAADLSALARGAGGAGRQGSLLDSDSEDDDSGALGGGLATPAGAGGGGRGGRGGARGAGGAGAAHSEGSMSPSPSDVSSSSRTPSPIAPGAPHAGGAGAAAAAAHAAAAGRVGGFPDYMADGARAYAGMPNGGGAGTGAYAARGAGSGLPYGQDPYERGAAGGYGARSAAAAAEEDGLSRYAEIILDYFISESTTIPPLLINPPPDFDANMSIDDDEHTALHWACAMGRIRVVKLLLSAGADVFRVNANGQTALMRAAMFSNNYDLRKFPELFELLHRSILNIDRADRTVFHHTVDLALSRAKPHAARYYLETMLARLSEYGSQLADMLNFQDDEGETPLTMAARARSKRLVRLLLEYGADPKIRNKEGKNAEDYIIEDERFRASPTAPGLGGLGLGGAAAGGSAGRAAAALGLLGGAAGGSGLAAAGSLLGIDGGVSASAASLHTSEAGQRAGGRAVQLMASLLHALADAYDAELAGADRRLAQAGQLLAQIGAELRERAAARDALARQADGGDRERAALAQLDDELRRSVKKRHAAEMLQAWDAAQQHAKRLRAANALPADGDALLAPTQAQPALANSTSGAGDALLAPLPAGASGDAYASELRALVSAAAERHASLRARFADAARDQGAGRTMAAYRRLISAGCGGIAHDEIDPVVNALCDMLAKGEQHGADGDAANPAAAGLPQNGQHNGVDAAALLRGAAAAAASSNTNKA